MFDITAAQALAMLIVYKMITYVYIQQKKIIIIFKVICLVQIQGGPKAASAKIDVKFYN